MGLSEALFDTNILIDFMRRVPAAQQELESCGHRCISRVTWIEVMAGMQAGEEAMLRRFLADFTVLEVSERIAEETAVIRRQRRLKLPDAIIFATAIAHDLVLVSRNTKDFKESERVRVPYRI